MLGGQKQIALRSGERQYRYSSLDKEGLAEPHTALLFIFQHVRM